MSRVERQDSPRAIIHKRILDVAESRPDASVEVIADEIGGATADLVERVLGEYGDPAGETSGSGEQEPAMIENGQATNAEETGTDDGLGDLTEKQRETLRLVHENPDASQADIAEALDVSRATVSRRLSDVPGFEWRDRETLTAELFDDDPGGGPDLGEGDDPESEDEQVDGEDEQAHGEDAADALERFDERLTALEEHLEEAGDGRSITLGPDLGHRVVHACMESDRISEAEELQLLEALLQSD